MTERVRYDVHGNAVYSSNDLQATATSYDALHRPFESINSDGTRSKTTFDGFGRLHTTTSTKNSSSAKSPSGRTAGKVSCYGSSTTTAAPAA
jgi:YD repeat-containing protein